MARLRKGEKEIVRERIYRLLRRHRYGLREAELAQLLGLERRTTNNYLRELAGARRAYREGACWYAD